MWATVDDLTAAGTAVVLTTHYLDEADRLADRVLVLAAGRLVADTTTGRTAARGAAAPTIRLPLPPGVPAADLPPGLPSPTAASWSPRRRLDADLRGLL